MTEIQISTIEKQTTQLQDATKYRSSRAALLDDCFKKLKSVDVHPDAFIIWYHYRYGSVFWWDDLLNETFNHGFEVIQEDANEMAAVRTATEVYREHAVTPIEFFEWSFGRMQPKQCYKQEDWRNLYGIVNKAAKMAGSAFCFERFAQQTYPTGKQVEQLSTLRQKLGILIKEHLTLIKEQFGWDARCLSRSQMEAVNAFYFQEWKNAGGGTKALAKEGKENANSKAED